MQVSEKTVARAKLSCDELVTVVTEDEMVLSCKDFEEPHTLAHLIIGQQISAIPELYSRSNEDFGVSHSDLNRRAKHLNMVLDHLLEMLESSENTYWSYEMLKTGRREELNQVCYLLIM